MDDTTGNLDAAEDLLQEAEARARAILEETGFEQVITHLESDEAWNALNAAKKASRGPLTPAMRASRASNCLVLVEWIRAAALDTDIDALIRHSVSLGSLDRDLAGLAQRDAIATRHRLANVAKSKRLRRDARDRKREGWKNQANVHRSKFPDASDRAVAKGLAQTSDASPETIRKALREERRKTAKTKARRNI
jgi:hypothetical protein